MIDDILSIFRHESSKKDFFKLFDNRYDHDFLMAIDELRVEKDEDEIYAKAATMLIFSLNDIQKEQLNKAISIIKNDLLGDKIIFKYYHILTVEEIQKYEMIYHSKTLPLDDKIVIELLERRNNKFLKYTSIQNDNLLDIEKELDNFEKGENCNFFCYNYENGFQIDYKKIKNLLHRLSPYDAILYTERAISYFKDISSKLENTPNRIHAEYISELLSEEYERVKEVFKDSLKWEYDTEGRIAEAILNNEQCSESNHENGSIIDEESLDNLKGFLKWLLNLTMPDALVNIEQIEEMVFLKDQKVIREELYELYKQKYDMSEKINWTKTKVELLRLVDFLHDKKFFSNYKNIWYKHFTVNGKPMKDDESSLNANAHPSFRSKELGAFLDEMSKN